MNYFDLKAISNSDLGHLNTIHHFLAYKSEEKKPTPAMELGTLTHLQVLEPEKFEEKYLICPYGDKRTKDYKDWLINEYAKNEHKTILSNEDLILSDNIAIEVKNHPVASELLKNGISEQELYFNYLNQDCRSKLDYINLDEKYIVDLKTMEGIKEVTKFNGSQVFNVEYRIKDFDYLRQAAFYTLGAKITYGFDFDFYFIFVDTKKPHGILIYKVHPLTMADRMTVIDERIERYKDYLAFGLPETVYTTEIITI